MAADLLNILNEPNIILIDARGGNDAYERYLKGHLSNAIFVNLEIDLSDKGADAAIGGRHPLPPPEKFSQLLGDLGITPSTRVIVYDDKFGANSASRFWWMLKATGHSTVQVVDGGLDALVKANLPINTTPSETRTLGDPYPFHNWKLPIKTIAEVDKAIDDKSALIIDVRENYRFRGESEPIDLVAGHIPGAINIPYINNLNEDGTFINEVDLQKMYDQAIADKEMKNVIVHCGSGVTACHTLLAMEQAGFSGANLYVGSWSEWSRTNRAIAKDS